jgi:hypothetical protein
MSVVKNQQFENFFADRENVTMSSYKVDPKTDQKEASEIYPDGMV